MKPWNYWRIPNFFRKQTGEVPTRFLGQKDLGIVHLVAFGIANILGAGIFVTIGVAAQQAGPGLFCSYILAAIAAVLSALCFAEYASKYPLPGSVYSYTYISLGELIAWIVGWLLTIKYAVTASALSVVWISYGLDIIQSLFNVKVPHILFGVDLPLDFALNPLAGLGILLGTIVSFFGMNGSMIVGILITVVNIGVLLFVIIFGAIHFNVDNWDNFFGIDHGWPDVQQVFTSAGIVFFNFIGFDAITTLSAEAKQPQLIPASIFISLSSSLLLYVGVAVVITGLTTAATIDPEAVMFTVFLKGGFEWAGIVISFGSLALLFANILTALMSQVRILYQMAEDGLLVGSFSWRSDRGVYPVSAIITAMFSAIVATFFDLPSLSGMISCSALLSYILICCGTVLLRYRSVTLEEDFADVPVVHFPKGVSYLNFSPLEPMFLIVSDYLPFFIILYIILNIFLGTGIQYSWPWSVNGVLIVLIVIVFLLIQLLRPAERKWTSFECPLVPFIPLLAITINVFLLMSLTHSLERVAIWTVVGLVFYLFYGIRNSKLNITSYALEHTATMHREFDDF
jgi:APA family basic amino acid/polyamine antiporter